MTVLPSILESSLPSAEVRARPTVIHGQLRDLLVCDKPGVVKYVSYHSIFEQDLSNSSSPRQVAELSFPPNTLASLVTRDDTTILAAGGHRAEIHISLHEPEGTTPIWQSDIQLDGTINNSVSLFPHLTSGNQEPRLSVSNNDCSVRFYDVPTRVVSSVSSLRDCGMLTMDYPINHCTLSPDGRTVLTVGDSNQVTLFKARGSSNLSFEPTTTVVLPTPSYFASLKHGMDVKAPWASSITTQPKFPNLESAHQFLENPTPTSLAAAFSASFSTSGMQFAVAGQEGLVSVWDVRSSKVLKVIETKPRPYPEQSRDAPTGNGSASGWLSDLMTSDPYLWSHGENNGPGWCVRNVKFSGAANGREIMAFTEHADFVHVVDARTFEREEIIRITLPRDKSPRTEKSSQSDLCSTFPQILATVDESEESNSVISAMEEVGQDVNDLVVTSASSTGSRWTVRDGVLYTRRLSDVSTSSSQEDGRDARSELEYVDDEEDAEFVCEQEDEQDSLQLDEEQVSLQDYTVHEEIMDEHRHPFRASRQLGTAGLCFDPTGSRIYVASTRGLAEWRIRGPGTRWFGGGSWL